MSYGMSTTVDRPFDEVLADVRGALAAQGFGIITEIDIKKTLHMKFGADTVLCGLDPCKAHFPKHTDVRIVGTPVRSAMRWCAHLRPAVCGGWWESVLRSDSGF